MKKYFGILLAMILLASCGQKIEEQVKETTVAPIKVKVLEVKTQSIDLVEKFTASVEPVIKNNIVPNSPGRIRKIMVELGDNVKKGQKLAQMDVANLSNLESQVANYKKMYQRAAELFEVGGASQQDLDAAKLQLNMAETNLKNLQENTFLISPINGVVTARNYDNDDIYNGQLPILTVMQMNPVQMKINVSETFFSKIKKTMPVDITLDVYEDKSFKGKVSLIYPTIDEMSRTFGVEIVADNASNQIRPGMFARVEMYFGKADKILVPDLSIIKQSGSGEKFVYVESNGTVSYVKVEVGRRYDSTYEIISGLKSGDKVVIAGQTKLMDGSKVEIIN